MAKSKSFFGLRRGSTKSLTFSVLNGQQITKDRVYGGKNPRSLAQMIQRMCLATASAGYAAMKQIVDHSFEGISYGANTMAEFIKVNTKLIKADYESQGENFAYNPYGDRGLKVGAYVMAKGTASPLDITKFGVLKSQNTLSIVMNVKAGQSITANDALEYLGLQVGEMATVCVIYAKSGSVDDWNFVFIRVTALAGGTTELSTANLGDYLLFESNNVLGSTGVTSGAISTTATIADADTEIDDIAKCVIHSVKANGAWLRSNATMALDAGTDVVPSAEDALATYPIGESYVLNGGEIE